MQRRSPTLRLTRNSRSINLNVLLQPIALSCAGQDLRLLDSYLVELNEAFAAPSCTGYVSEQLTRKDPQTYGIIQVNEDEGQ